MLGPQTSFLAVGLDKIFEVCNMDNAKDIEKYNKK
jgi:hypothetical protein